MEEMHTTTFTQDKLPMVWKKQVNNAEWEPVNVTLSPAAMYFNIQRPLANNGFLKEEFILADVTFVAKPKEKGGKVLEAELTGRWINRLPDNFSTFKAWDGPVWVDLTQEDRQFWQFAYRGNLTRVYAIQTAPLVVGKLVWKEQPSGRKVYTSADGICLTAYGVSLKHRGNVGLDEQTRIG